MKYKIQNDYNKLDKVKKDELKEKMLIAITGILSEQFLTKNKYSDEAFQERFKTLDRHKVYSSNVHYIMHNSNVIEWIQSYGDSLPELLHAYGISTPKEHSTIYTVEQFSQNYDIAYNLVYCSPDYDESLRELKEASSDGVCTKAILVGWYKGYPQFVQWSYDGEVEDKEIYNGDNATTNGLTRLPYNYETSK